jgi:chitodextrinase
MKIISYRRLLPVFVTLALVSGTYVHGYVSEGHVWSGTNVVSYYVNPSSIYVSPDAAISAVQQAAAGWGQQSRANISLVYAGTTNGTSLTLNGKNEVFFRNTSNGGNVAETYYWWDGAGKMIDADIIVYEGAYRFYTVSGCSGGIYIENVLIHEFGHVLGLAHSPVPGATMAASMSSYCDLTQLTLEPDDIQGIEALYPPSSGPAAPTAPASLSVSNNPGAPQTSLVLNWADTSNVETGFRIERSNGGAFAQVAQVGANVTTFTNTGLVASTNYWYRVVAFNGTGTSGYSNTGAATTASAATNNPPSVSMNNPVDNSSYPEGSTISFSATATDPQDGNISGNLRWTSNLMGSIGNGASFSRSLTAGTHMITAAATDRAGLTGSAQVSMTVTVSAPPPPQQQPVASNISLSASSTTVKNKTKVALNWSGASGSRVDIFRNNSRLTTTSNSGSWTDSVAGRNGSYSYKVCNAGTSSCSNTAQVNY